MASVNQQGAWISIHNVSGNDKDFDWQNKEK